MNDLMSRSFSGPRSYVDLRHDRDLEAGGETEMTVVDSERNLALFLEEANEIQAKMKSVEGLLARLQQANEESKSIHKAQAVKAIRQRMDKDVEQVLKLAKSIKAQLEELDKANAANRKIAGFGAGTPTDRTRTSLTASMRKKLKDIMGDFQELRQRMKGEYREAIGRRYFTVTGTDPDEETLETMIETGESETFLQRAIQEQGRGQVMETIREIQERHDAVREIEKNLLELHQIFLDMAVLVEAQGEQLNSIEDQVHRASSFVARGTTNLQVAKKHQRSARKWTCIGIIILIIVVIVILVPILVRARNNSSSPSPSPNPVTPSPPPPVAPPPPT
ncbi:hypothetical protein SELMODRAFT_151097 [Selaginella moellendorffii]|uniref:t-SNARE coiled-coil homology domain-containing protein n=1 Tax=Selaginella moellendorffii TaxID=88036 RepID=D8RYP7_SELML|nr:syntaxin-125 [Selaginella moellendorffii]EFJ22470.1 hypothetical protein SELMODRAFT_151097 [Selaginella moellendorffii]|eukprot:XP_002976210.1 syntaxin-125 [Selaginella moellendorffii]